MLRYSETAIALKTFARKVRKKYDMEPSRFKLERARKAALVVVHGDEIKQFSLLWRYGKELLARNCDAPKSAPCEL
jgi:hypothetical protein